MQFTGIVQPYFKLCCGILQLQMLVEITVIVKALQMNYDDHLEHNKRWEKKMRSLKYGRGIVHSLILFGFLLLVSLAIRSYERGD